MSANGSDPRAAGAEVSANILLFSEKLKDLIAQAVGSGAMHPAAVIGVLSYHSSAVSSHFQQAFVGAARVPGIVAPPPGFRLPPPNRNSGDSPRT